MTQWTSAELDAIDGSDELEVASRRADGSLRSNRIVWVVRDGDDLYVRSVRGADGAWYRGVQTSHAGHVSSGGVEKDVAFVDAGRDLDDRLDAAYRSKYRNYATNIVDSIVTEKARATTLRLDPS